MKKRIKPRPPRDWQAVEAHLRSGAGNHGDERKEASRKECRDYGKKVGPDDGTL